ncbi:hypothetical protein LGQ02_19045 [Bacillus shivajii]|uniref:hypothetical protein n=1 Tax=Bacillus shivajii TaxID=1983719 RepID=UPI001CFB3116|nr:hypothetical protein [Bacillus shivajii]UCZ52853.1 hypothetical protein LGQ02_19045 [Bacillus shivajii]
MISLLFVAILYFVTFIGGIIGIIFGIGRFMPNGGARAKVALAFALVTFAFVHFSMGYLIYF